MVTGDDNPACGIWAVVPVRTFAAAKLRLASVLSPPERERLAQAMFEDVAATLSDAGGLAGLIVVTPDRNVASLAADLKCRIIREPDNSNLNNAVKSAAKLLVQDKQRGMIVIPADVPFLTTADVATAIDLLSNWPVVVNRAAADGGTNLLGLRPPTVIEPCFGPDSFEAHMSAALRAGVDACACTLPSLSIDIDRPEDLAAFASLPGGSRTRKVLGTIAI